MGGAPNFRGKQKEAALFVGVQIATQIALQNNGHFEIQLYGCVFC